MWFAKATFLFVRKEAVKNGKEAIFYRRSALRLFGSYRLRGTKGAPWRRRLVRKNMQNIRFCAILKEWTTKKKQKEQNSTAQSGE
ncbi:MAG: hypothetical protein IKQ13_07030 [Treponema sp.]|nr:hypothetical protein [Treponema sp.]